MMSENPYHSPQDASAVSAPSPKLLIWSIVAVLSTSFVGGALGMAIGAAMGTWMPDYYRSIFSGGDAPHFNPLAVGMGQGLGQGVVFGGGVGMVLVFMFYRYRARRLV